MTCLNLGAIAAFERFVLIQPNWNLVSTGALFFGLRLQSIGDVQPATPRTQLMNQVLIDSHQINEREGCYFYGANRAGFTRRGGRGTDGVCAPPPPLPPGDGGTAAHGLSVCHTPSKRQQPPGPAHFFFYLLPAPYVPFPSGSPRL